MISLSQMGGFCHEVVVSLAPLPPPMIDCQWLRLSLQSARIGDEWYLSTALLPSRAHMRA